MYKRITFTILKGYEYFKLFNKQVFYNKIAYIWSLVIPIVFLMINRWNGQEAHTYEVFASSTIFFWTYMILITAADGIGMGLLFMRDSNFLKMYTYISGSKFPIILGKVFSQLFFLWVNMVVFLIFSALVYQQPIWSLLLMSILILIPIGIPTYFLFVIPATLKVRAASLGPLLTLGVLLCINVMQVRLHTDTIADAVIYLNPAMVVNSLIDSIHLRLLNDPIEMVWIPLCFLVLYLFIGLAGYRKLDIVSREAR